MPSDHRGRPIGDNYRPTPRLAKLMARAISHDTYYGSPLSHNRPPEVTPSQAQDALNNYRYRRDTEGADLYGHSQLTKERASQISTAREMKRLGYF